MANKQQAMNRRRRCVAGQGEGGDSLLVPALAGREGADRGTGGHVQGMMHVKAAANVQGGAEASRQAANGTGDAKRKPRDGTAAASP
jgi:hypothetical protein